jgi:hypothetical protein
MRRKGGIMGNKRIEEEGFEGDQEEVVSKEVCPYCGKVFAEFDKYGCSISDCGRCDDVIGEGDDDDLSFLNGFDILYNIRDLYGEIEACKEICDYIHHLTGIDFNVDGYLTEFLDEFPEISVSTHEWFGGAPGCSGNYSYITVARQSQTGLLKNLTDIRDRLAMFVEGKSFAEGIEAKLEAPEN